MAQPSRDLRNRAFVAARRRVQTLNSAGEFKSTFRKAATPRSGRAIGGNLVTVDGTIYRATVTHGGAPRIYVANAGRPAAARYVQTSENGEVEA